MLYATLSWADAKEDIVAVRNFANNPDTSLDHCFQFVHKLLVIKVSQFVPDKVMRYPLYCKRW